jgi:hypothetical protein
MGKETYGLDDESHSSVHDHRSFVHRAISLERIFQQKTYRQKKEDSTKSLDENHKQVTLPRKISSVGQNIENIEQLAQ